jgi:signal transduction histidine kinase
MNRILGFVFPLQESARPSARNEVSAPVASPGAEAWMVFGMRLLLAVSALLILYIGQGGIARPGEWAWLVFAAYALHSLVLLLVARSRANYWHGPVVYWIDIGWYGLMIQATGGGPSPFFSFFFFAILAASFRHGFDSGARLTLGATLVVTIAVMSTHDQVRAHLLLLRATFVLALGYMIAFWGGLSVDQRRRLALLRDVSRLSNPRFGVQHTLDSLIQKVLRFYGARTCVLLMQDGEEWTLTTAHHPSSGRAIGRLSADGAAVQPLLDLGEGATILYRSRSRFLPARGARALRLAAGEQVWRACGDDACSAIADLLDTDCFISAALPLRKGSGRIFITGARLRRNDATFLNHIVQQAFPVIETIDLLDRLASDAAFRERQTIARDLHDSTIQPYIGLRHAVAAIRNQAGEGNELAPELDRLLAMTSDVIGDMREFAQRFRNGRQQEPELLIALRRQLNQIRAFYNVEVTLDAKSAPAINDRVAAQVFQLVTEGISNVCKHTRARTASVVLGQHGEGQLAIDIVNPNEDGAVPVPFRPRSIGERVQGLGGELTVDYDGQDTLLRIRLPI